MNHTLYPTLMKKKWIILFIILLSSTACDGRRSTNTGDSVQIAGCWKGRQISRFDRPFSERILFTCRRDSSLALSMIYEIGPRSRVWTFDADVTIREGTMRWEDHEGLLSKNNDTMNVTRVDRGGKSVWLYVRDRSADSLMTQLHAYTAGPYVYEMPERRNDGWQCADLAASGMDKSRIIDLIEQIRNGKHDDIHSFLVVKDNKLVVEEYFAANGKKHGRFITGLFREKVHHLASTTKSVTSTLVGIAIDQGFIRDVEDPIYQYLPAYSSLFSEDKKRIRICDMLTMTPGFEWRQFGVSDDRNDGMRMWNTDDVIGYVLQKPLEAKPGEKFNYTNGVPTVTGAIIKNAVGMEVGKFAEKYLFQPLGISEYVWTSYPDGSIETDGGLALRSRDLAKIGQLFLNKGLWNGKRIVSEQWVRESTKERLKFGNLFSRWGYGYHWMETVTRVRNREVRSYFVPGDGNQILAVFPDLGMVIVFTAGNYGKDPKPIYYSVFEEFILPAVIPEG
ncbi:MAG: serine hydrolase [Ignavibacteria bacterium]|nr:serine hydrolase [Ignavibacteria bacterium]